jgi:hypothetical protein
MDELKLASMVGLLMSQLEAVRLAGMLPANTQIVIRPIYTWPDGQPAIWVIVNTPN